MGLGDWIMATSQVRELNERTGKRVVVVDRLNRPKWSEAFDNNPRIARTHENDCERLLNAGGARPYIRSKTVEQWQWRKWDIKPGELWLSPEERDFGRPYDGRFIIEPTTKDPASNKAWIADRWQELVDRFPAGTFVQMGADPVRCLRGATFVRTTVRQAFGVLAAARGFVGTEGALHHAAAALKTPAVVLWSEFISPTFTGYPEQTNIRHAHGVCGKRVPCPTCRESMEAITVDEVEQAVRRLM